MVYGSVQEISIGSPMKSIPRKKISSSMTLLTSMLMAHLQDRNLWSPMRGGGKPITSRESYTRAAKRPLPKLPSHPPLVNPVVLPIPQLAGMQMAVAKSTIVDELGLFSLNGADTDVLLCTYAGTKLRDVKKVTDESLRFDYLWENSKSTLIIDAYLQHSCFGRYLCQ